MGSLFLLAAGQRRKERSDVVAGVFPLFFLSMVVLYLTKLTLMSVNIVHSHNENIIKKNYKKKLLIRHFISSRKVTTSIQIL